MLTASPSSPGFLWALSTELGRPGAWSGAGGGEGSVQSSSEDVLTREASAEAERASSSAVSESSQFPFQTVLQGGPLSWGLPAPVLA